MPKKKRRVEYKKTWGELIEEGKARIVNDKLVRIKKDERGKDG